MSTARRSAGGGGAAPAASTISVSLRRYGQDTTLFENLRKRILAVL
jgi:hypothetical protein